MRECVMRTIATGHGLGTALILQIVLFRRALRSEIGVRPFGAIALLVAGRALGLPYVSDSCCACKFTHTHTRSHRARAIVVPVRAVVVVVVFGQILLRLLLQSL